MGKKAKTPKAPDYQALANADKFNTSGPYGTGAWQLRPGADPKNTKAGDWTKVLQLSEGQQGLYDQGVTNKLAAALAGQSMIGDLGNQKTMADALYGKATQYMGQQFGDQEAALNTQLQNQGLMQGSEAYEKAMRNFMQTRNQAYEGAANSAVINADTAQNNAVQRIAQLLAATRETLPQGPGGENSNAMQAADASYKAALDKANAKAAGQNQDMQTALQLAGTAAMFFSDRRLKSNISLIGVRSGLPLYEYDIGGRRERGFMADEVATIAPDAVHEHPSGYLMVDYNKIGGRP